MIWEPTNKIFLYTIIKINFFGVTIMENEIKFKEYKIYKRGNAWYLYIDKKLTGKNIRESLKTSTQTEAIEFARERFKQIKGEVAANCTFHNSFEANANEFLATTNNPQHKEYMNRCFIPYFCNKIGQKSKINDIRKLTNLDIIKYVEYRKKIPSKRKNNNTNIPVKPATIVRENNTLRTFLKWCYENERINKPLQLPTIKTKENVFDEAGNPIFDDLSGHRDAFSDNEIKLILTTLLKEIRKTVNRHTQRRKILLYYYINILHQTGIRMCELRTVVWSQFIPEYREGGLLCDVYSAKQKKKRNIAISPELSNLLQKLKNKQKNFCKAHNLPFDENTVKIISQCNSNLELDKFELKAVNELDNGFRNLLNRCNIKHKNYKVLYSFRHTYITKLVESKTPILNIAKQCGTGTKMIEEYYDQSSHLQDMALLFIKTPKLDEQL